MTAARPVLIADMRPCGNPDCERWFAPALRHPGQVYCTKVCGAADRSARQAEANRCARCWKPNPDAGTHLRCPACRKKAADKMKRKRAARRTAGRCEDCGKPVKAGGWCGKHKVSRNRRNRKYEIRLAMEDRP